MRTLLLSLLVLAPTVVRADLAARERSETCTIKGQVSELCVKYRVDHRDVATRKAEEPNLLYGCFERASRFDHGARESASEAEDLVQLGDKSDAANECYRLTTLALGNDDWRKQADAKAAHRNFMLAVGGEIAAKFKTTCGVSAYLQNPLAFTLVLEKAHPSKKTFATRTDPEGNKITIRCDGTVSIRFKSGGGENDQPKTEADRYKDAAQDQCLRECGAHSAACGGLEPGAVGGECLESCKASCP
jgi:hypothetical protein